MNEKKSLASLRHGTIITLAFFLVFFALGMQAGAEGITITQIDASRLLSSQSVRLYLDVDPAPGQTAPEADCITVAESANGTDWTEVPVRSVSKSANTDEGISFFLLLDNSGSMWDGLDGKPSEDTENIRINHAKNAIRSFVEELSPVDRAGLAVFNTNLKTVYELSADSSGIPPALEGITKPARDEAYTELYGSVETTLNAFGEEGRRKALIILSDGEHFPFPPKGSTVTIGNAVDAAIRDGITCYVVNFATSGDVELPRIAAESGGLVFNARNSDELIGIYNTIRTNIQSEYALTYTASMLSGDKRYVRVSVKDSASALETVRYYYAGNVLGSGAAAPEAWMALVALIPLALWVALLFFKLERQTSAAGIQLLYGAGGTTTKAYELTSALTVIGGDETADITIAGNPAMKANAATIAFDEGKGLYTITATSDLTVNNKPVKTKRLEPGDVINMAGTVVVFDDKEKKPQARKKSK